METGEHHTGTESQIRNKQEETAGQERQIVDVARWVETADSMVSEGKQGKHKTRKPQSNKTPENLTKPGRTLTEQTQ